MDFNLFLPVTWENQFGLITIFFFNQRYFQKLLKIHIYLNVFTQYAEFFFYFFFFFFLFIWRKVQNLQSGLRFSSAVSSHTQLIVFNKSDVFFHSNLVSVKFPMYCMRNQMTFSFMWLLLPIIYFTILCDHQLSYLLLW